MGRSTPTTAFDGAISFVYAWIVPLWADQLLPQLLMEQFDTLPIQCRHIEHMHEGVYNFCLHRFF